MRPIVTDIAWSVCLLVSTASCEQTERETVWAVDSGGPRKPIGGGNFSGMSRAMVIYRECLSLVRVIRWTASAMRPFAVRTAPASCLLLRTPSTDTLSA